MKSYLRKRAFVKLLKLTDAKNFDGTVSVGGGGPTKVSVGGFGF